jgi:hypothetical protein
VSARVFGRKATRTCLRGHDSSVTCLPHYHVICALVVWGRADGLKLRIRTANTIELHLSVLIGTASHPDMQKIRIIGFFFEVSYMGSYKFGC